MSTIEQEGGSMSSTLTRRPMWQLPAARAVAALAVGIVIPFLQLHAAIVGLVAFAVFAALTGAALLWLRGAVLQEVVRWPIVSGAASLVAAVGAALLALAAPTPDALAAVVAAWAVVAAAAEGWAAWRMRAIADPQARRIVLDWRTVAVLTGIAAIVFAVLPRHEVVLVGLVGAYAVIVGVFHGIAAYSARVPVRADAATDADQARTEESA